MSRFFSSVNIRSPHIKSIPSKQRAQIERERERERERKREKEKENKERVRVDLWRR